MLVILKINLNRGGVPLNFYEGGWGSKNINVGGLENFSVGVGGLKIF